MLPPPYSVTIIFGTVLYITILGSVTSIVSNMNIAKSKKMAQLNAVLTHLHQTKASRQLVHQIRSSYDFMWADESSSPVTKGFTQEISTLPKTLQVRFIFIGDGSVRLIMHDRSD